MMYITPTLMPVSFFNLTILKSCFQFEVIINLLVSFFRFIWISMLRACHTLAIRLNDRVTHNKISPSLDHRYAIVVCVYRSLLIADQRWWTLKVLNWFKTLNAHQRVRGDARGALIDRCMRYGNATQSLYTLGERYSIVVHARRALLSRCTILLINHNRHMYINI